MRGRRGVTEQLLLKVPVLELLLRVSLQLLRGRQVGGSGVDRPSRRRRGYVRRRYGLSLFFTSPACRGVLHKSGFFLRRKCLELSEDTEGHFRYYFFDLEPY